MFIRTCRARHVENSRHSHAIQVDWPEELPSEPDVTCTKVIGGAKRGSPGAEPTSTGAAASFSRLDLRNNQHDALTSPGVI